MKKSKNMVTASGKYDAMKAYLLDEAISILKDLKYSKFDESVDLALNLGVNPRHADENIRFTTSLPHGTGKKVSVLVIASGPKEKEAEQAGADFVGNKEYLVKIKNGWTDIDKIIATPDMMPIVGRLGKVLGPRNLMPNPKVGTVTPDVAAAVSAAKNGEVQFKAEKAGVVQVGIGKASFDKKKLVENYNAFMTELKKSKPTGAKGVFIKKISMSSTMGKSMTIDNST